MRAAAHYDTAPGKASSLDGKFTRLHHDRSTEPKIQADTVSDGEKPRKPHLTGKARESAEARRRRQAAALRENLRKRKRQSRGRADDKPPPPDEKT